MTNLGDKDDYTYDNDDDNEIDDRSVMVTSPHVWN